MILAVAILAGLGLSLLSGGSWRELEAERLRGEWIILLLFPLQLLWPTLSERLGLGCALSTGLWLAMMVLLALVLFINSGSRWMLALAALGIAMNVLVIGLNGAMPVSLDAAQDVGMLGADAKMALDNRCLHDAAGTETRLFWLADIMGIPGPSWVRGVLSLGDLFLAAGLSGWLFVASRPRFGVRSD
jgi:hypothetical protein